MTLQQKLIASMSVIGTFVFIGLFIIFRSASGVQSIAEQQLLLTQEQNNAVSTLNKNSETIKPSFELIRDISSIREEISYARFLFVEASLTLASNDLSTANTKFEEAQKNFLQFLKSNAASSEDISLAQEAFWAANIYGNKVVEFRLKDLAMTAGEMAVGLTQEMEKLEGILNKISDTANERVESNLQQVLLAISEVQSKAQSNDNAAREIAGTADQVANTVLIVAFIVVSLCLGITFILNKSIKKATKQVVKTLSKIRNNKDLSLRINRAEKDELGQIAHDVDAMMEAFEELLKEVLNTANGVSHELGEMDSRSRSLNSMIDQQKQSLDEIAAAISQMSTSADLIAENARSTLDTTQSANDISRSSAQVIHNNINSIEGLSEQISNSEAKINLLANDVASITSILGVIESIAEQTNLLALNAAIESARAGEHGRGFAVVADEVRGLAQRTQQSVEEIKRNINSLNDRTLEAVSAMQASRETSAESVEQAQQTNKAISEITGSLHEVTQRISIIAESANEQSGVSQNISLRVGELSHKSHDLADKSNDNLEAGQRVSLQGEKLTQATSLFNFS